MKACAFKYAIVAGAGGASLCGAAHGGCWGLARVLRLEQPALRTTRAAVLDYFHEQGVSEGKLLFNSVTIDGYAGRLTEPEARAARLAAARSQRVQALGPRQCEALGRRRHRERDGPREQRPLRN